MEVRGISEHEGFSLGLFVCEMTESPKDGKGGKKRPMSSAVRDSTVYPGGLVIGLSSLQ